MRKSGTRILRVGWIHGRDARATQAAHFIQSLLQLLPHDLQHRVLRWPGDITNCEILGSEIL